MKKLIIIAMVTLVLPLTVAAQDDLYFVPTKANVKKTSEKYGIPKDTYYCGSTRDVDEYNRRLRSTVEPIDGDSVGNDVIKFDAVRGEYPDSLAALAEDDYKCTRKMSRWDDDYREAYWYGYTDGRFNRWYGWSSFYDPWYYGSWYGGWYDPWYCGWHSYYGWHGYYGWGGWYDPWYYGWGGYYPYYPIYVGGGGRGYYGERDRFVNTRYDRASLRLDNVNSRSVGRSIANRDRSNNISRNTSRSESIRQRFNTTDTQRYNATRSNETRQNSFNSGSFNRSSNSGSFNSGSNRSFNSGGGGGSFRSSGGGVRMGRR